MGFSIVSVVCTYRCVRFWTFSARATFCCYINVLTSQGGSSECCYRPYLLYALTLSKVPKT